MWWITLNKVATTREYGGPDFIKIWTHPKFPTFGDNTPNSRQYLLLREGKKKEEKKGTKWVPPNFENVVVYMISDVQLTET